MVAKFVYGKSNPHSYKARQIRYWADLYMRTGIDFLRKMETLERRMCKFGSDKSTNMEEVFNYCLEKKN